MYAVVNHLHFNKPVAEIKQSVAEEGLPLLATLPGFQDFYFVQEADDKGVIIIIWADGASAAAAAQVFGPTWFAQNIMPNLAAPQGRSSGEVLVAY